MALNREAYQSAYQRGLAGKGSRPIWEIFLAPFEDTYTRQSREEGWRDGVAARETAAPEAPEPAAGDAAGQVH